MNEGEVRYRFLSVVGIGGFGKVYRARLETAEGFHKDVAIKILNDDQPAPSLLKRFRDEAKILGRVRDRAIVGVEPPIKVGGQWAVVMEYVDGVSAGALVYREPLPLGVAVEIVGEIARALHNAFHMKTEEGSLQLLHRDIKPDNIQVTPSGDIRLLDFGIAKANFAEREFHTRQSLGGTPGYIAPERLQRTEVPEGDVFSLGVVLHELVTGNRPKFSPTVHFETQFVEDDDDSAPVGLAPVGSEGVVVETEDLEVDEALLANPDTMKVLTLAGWMRAHEHDRRPAARQVEEACRALRQQLPPPFLREWAEQNVPHRNELDPDHLVGEVLSTTSTSILRETQLPAPATTGSIPAVVPAESTTRGSMAFGAIMGIGASSIAVLALFLVVILAMLAYALTQLPGDPVSDANPDLVEVVEPVPEPVLSPEPVVPEPVVPEPVVPEPKPEQEPKVDPRPAPVAPKKPDPVVIALPGTELPTPQPAEPAPVPSTPAPARTGPTGLVIVRTIPTGATVREGGKILVQTGRGFLLPTGTHTLDLESPSGEHTRMPVFVRTDDTVEICYSFDTNSACGQ